MLHWIAYVIAGISGFELGIRYGNELLAIPAVRVIGELLAFVYLWMMSS